VIRLAFGFLLAASLLLPAAGAVADPAASAATGPPGAADGQDPAQRWFDAANRIWVRQFAALGAPYPAPALRCFHGRIAGACGSAAALSGPFYCPAERRVYLDEDYLERLTRHAPATEADLIVAFVIGHEIGHHVQNVLGTTDLVEQARARSTPALSARTWLTQELQADCYAGIAAAAAQRLGTARIASALAAIGAASRDEKAHLPRGLLMADPIGSSGTDAQHLRWFERGAAESQMNACDTFGAASAGTL
jgi:predicted metalloprotease